MSSRSENGQAALENGAEEKQKVGSLRKPHLQLLLVDFVWRVSLFVLFFVAVVLGAGCLLVLLFVYLLSCLVL